MTPEALAALHKAAFDTLRSWTTEEFAALLQSPFVFATGDTRAFAMGRVIADEVELLTIATDPAHRRLGLGAARLADFHDAAAQRGATRSFLEVAADNTAAIALYLASGYAQDGRRPGYYRLADGRRLDALLMSRALP